MKIIPKYLTGGSFESFFTTYVPIQWENPTTTKQSSSSSKSNTGELTLKDFFNMIKDIDGLPNDMNEIVSKLSATFLMANLTGLDTGELATIYLENLYLIKVANLNYNEYLEAIKRATANGSLAEPAISTDGRLVALDNEGNLTYISLNLYYDNPNNYHLLSVSNLANLRKYEPSLAYNQSILDIINNSTGFEEFLTLVDKAKASLGNSKYSETIENTALEGLKQIENLSEDEKFQLLLAINNGSINYSNESNLSLIQRLLSYITSVLPNRVKIWASIKTNNPNKDDAITKLVGEYLLSSSKISQTVRNKELKSKTESSDNSLAVNPNMGFWSQVLAGFGEDGTYNIISRDVLASSKGKYYGTTPGLDEYKSLSKYINDSGVGYIIKNRNNITFGDNKLINLEEIVVDPNGGAFVITLPITTDGKVNFSILEDYNDISNLVIAQGYKKDTKEYNIALAQELLENGMGYLLEGVSVNPQMFGRFLVLQGIGSSKTQISSKNKKISLDKSNSNFIIDSSLEDQLFDVLEDVLSTEHSKLKLDNNILDFGPFSNDKIYRGNIFIPLTNNPNAGMNADNNDIRRAKAYEFENDYQTNERRSKLEGLKSTSSEIL